MMTDSEFAAWLRTVPREKSEAEVMRAGLEHDAEAGPYVPHGRIAHHSSNESRH